jgi:hypothetical protein
MWSLTTPPSADDVSALLKEMAPQSRALFVSGFSGKQITESIATYLDPERGIIIRSIAHNGVFPEGFHKKVLKCWTTELKNNPAALGSLKMRAKFRGGKLSTVDLLDNNNTFNDSLNLCVKRTLEELAPVIEGAQEFVVDI